MTKSDRTRLVQLAVVATVLAALHHVDHALRGNHVGWPLIARVTPFTPSLLVYLFLIPGIIGTRRGQLGARYWLMAGIPMLLLVVAVHFNPDSRAEQISDLYVPYADPEAYCGSNAPVDAPHHGASWLCDPPARARPWLGALAVGNMLALVLVLILLVLTAWRMRELAPPARRGPSHSP